MDFLRGDTMQDINNQLAKLVELLTSFFEAYADDAAEIKASLAEIETLLSDIKTNTTK